MIFSLCILAKSESPGAETAWAFACALKNDGHRLLRVFFQADGVTQARPDSHWLHLQHQHSTDLVVCSAAVAERRLATDTATQLHGFAIGGLAQLIDATTHSDCLITFGP